MSRPAPCPGSRGPAPGCPAPEDLTALAHGEGSVEERAALLRHVLACPPCHAEHEAARAMLLRLAALGAARASGADLRASAAGPASAEPLPTAAPRPRLGWLLGALPPVAAALLVALTLTLPRPTGDADDGAPPEGTGLAAAGAAPAPLRLAHGPRLADVVVTQLLAAQAADGRWHADGELSGLPGDACATGVVLLALLRDGAASLERASVEAAVVAATRWLEAESSALCRTGEHGLDRLRAQAVLSAALLRVGELRPDVRTQEALERLLEGLVAGAEEGAADRATRPWLEYALASAETQGWRAAGRARRLLPEAPRGAPRETPEAGAEAPRTCTALGLALEALRDAPPVRTLALAPVCRVAALVR